ncbi:MAG: hypothetical protein ACLPWS_18150 [Rhodomicrobium sp.]
MRRRWAASWKEKTMLGLQYTEMALDHWKKWRPKQYRLMQAEGTLNQVAQSASKEAARQVAELMAAGYQKHEAEEVVLRETILLPPEKYRTSRKINPRCSRGSQAPASRKCRRSIFRRSISSSTILWGLAREPSGRNTKTI